MVEIKTLPIFGRKNVTLSRVQVERVRLVFQRVIENKCVWSTRQFRLLSVASLLYQCEKAGFLRRLYLSLLGESPDTPLMTHPSEISNKRSTFGLCSLASAEKANSLKVADICVFFRQQGETLLFY